MLDSPFVLFIYKSFYIYQNDEQPIVPPLFSTGLKLSAQLVVNMLIRFGFDAKLVEAKDQNGIQELVSHYRPDRVVLEAIWVTPAKMQELVAANPKVRWVVRVHSEIPFLANEGMALAWIASYMELGVEITFNSSQTVKDFSVMGTAAYLPNYYPQQSQSKRNPQTGTVNIGCFGSIRPLKNQLIQAFAAIAYANKIGRKLIFHINGARVEQSGANNLKNIKALFDATGNTLILHSWENHEDFLELVASMDICLGVSLSESFCITAADAVSQGVPFVGSEAIRWLPFESQAPTDNVEAIVRVMEKASSHRFIKKNTRALESFSNRSVRVWSEWMGD